MIDAAEVRANLPKISSEDLSAFFIATDKNEDGLISFQEYMKASLMHEKGDLDLNDHKVYWLIPFGITHNKISISPFDFVYQLILSQ